MSASPQIRFGILRTRELAALYYGAGMVATDQYSGYTVEAGATQQLLQDNPRRISYEIVLSLNSSTGAAVVQLGPQSQIEAGNVGSIALYPTENLTVERTFREELDLVCKGLSLNVNSGATASVYAFVREVWLTPLPADELP